MINKKSNGEEHFEELFLANEPPEEEYIGCCRDAAPLPKGRRFLQPSG